ncbi:M protein [Varroa jacobsoni rhabdovirus 2]|nr:M protein [Varroa jacobsoni rhabdovirus 2]
MLSRPKKPSRPILCTGSKLPLGGKGSPTARSSNSTPERVNITVEKLTKTPTIDSSFVPVTISLKLELSLRVRKPELLYQELKIKMNRLVDWCTQQYPNMSDPAERHIWREIFGTLAEVLDGETGSVSLVSHKVYLVSIYTQGSYVIMVKPKNLPLNTQSVRVISNGEDIVGLKISFHRNLNPNPGVARIVSAHPSQLY